MSYRDYLRQQSLDLFAVPLDVPVDIETGELCEPSCAPGIPLSEQIHSMHNGGLPLHPLGEAVFDEDDVSEVDPANRYGIDSFEYHEALSARAKKELKSKRAAKSQSEGAATPSAPPTPPVSSGE